MLTISHLTKKFTEEQTAVDDFSLDIAHGEFIVLIGPSGCGKSTTLRMLNRLIEPTSGSVVVDGTDYRNYKEVELRRKLGYVIQQIGLMPHLSIAENISFVLRLQGVSKQRRRARAEELMKIAGLDAETYLDRFPRELSGGQQQRIGVLRALAHNPEIILMDEPFGALDPIMREQLQDELKRLQQTMKKTIVFVTHDMDEALRLADRIVLMRDGKIVQVATPEEMLRHPANDFVTSFVGRQRMLRQASEVQVAEVMAEKVITIQPQQGLAEALELMRRRRVDSLMVRDEAGMYRGIVLLRDVQRALETNQKGPVKAYAVLADAGVSPEAPVMNAIHHMLAYQLDAVPVIEDEKLTGVVTRGALAGILDDALQASASEPDGSVPNLEVIQ